MERLIQVYDALMSMRAPITTDEYSLHTLAMQALQGAGLKAEHEVLVAPRSRVDILSDGIGIEIKRGRPNKTSLLRQLERYAKSDKILGMLVICEHGLLLPEQVADKPVKVLSLNRLWGIALPGGKPMEERQQTQLAQREVPSSPAQASASSEATTPSYLQPVDISGHLYGTLSYNRQRKGWTIKGDPAVTEMAKRLFPGSNKGRRGSAFFTANRRSVGDVNWLMQRYPLEIAARDLNRWQEQLEGARKHYQHLSQLEKGLPTVSLKDTAFNGNLRAFQQAGLNWLYQTPRGLLADEMGLGKTVQALACVAAHKANPVMIVVPPHLIRNWQSEIQRFLTFQGHSPQVHVLKGLKPYPLPEADIYLMHYLLLRGWKQALPQMPFQMIIFDEIQELRHSGTEKYSAASLLAESCEKVIGLSGTPIYNHGGEIWNVVNILDFHMLGDWESFTREWCYGYGNAIVAKPDLLGDHLRREGVMLRRTKAEVLPELPDKRRLVQEIDTDSAVYRLMMQPVLQNLKRWRDNQTMTPSERALLEGNISQGQRQATGLAKAPYVSQFVRALVESGEKVLLFAHHHAVMDLYKKELRTLSPAFITGRETGAQKENSVERFMAGRTDLCCISLRAASGLNLQRATCVVFGELDWSPAVHSQAEDRAHRIGQKDSLLCYYLVSPEGSDADIQEALGLKVSQFLGLMGEKPPGSEVSLSSSHARTHVEKLIQRYISGSETQDISV